MKWTYVDDYGRRFNVGLFHGDRTGHLMIYCNTRILVIDFNVLETKKYSFFINDELCDIHVERRADDRFAYGFKFDHKTATPRNKLRKRHERKSLIRSLWLVAALVLVVGIAAFLLLGGIEYF
ncbi:MAG: hypothetical protein R3301_02165 [Saprospiraceae bacterium]|nr:hypothetical protein [Saprospiraceae bacterium]